MNHMIHIAAATQIRLDTAGPGLLPAQDRRWQVQALKRCAASLDEYGDAGQVDLFVGNGEGRPRCLATAMACLSWSPSSLPGGVIGAREQPQRGPNNEEPTVDPATSGDVRPGGHRMFCGWDWGSTMHGVCLLDDDGATVKTWMVNHTDTELAALFAELAELGDPALIPVAIERGEGLVVGLIARAGHPVLMVEPAAFKASRPRWGAAGAKSDAADAFMLADYARTDGHRLRRVEPLAQATRELAALVRARTCLGRGTHRSVQPAVGHPGRALARRCAGLPEADITDRVGVLGRLPHAPVSGTARGGTHAPVLPPAQLSRRQVPRGAGQSAPSSARQRGPDRGHRCSRRSFDPPSPRSACSTSRSPVLNASSHDTLATHPKTALLKTLPRVATVSLAALIAEIGPLLERCENPEQVAAMCGAAPVTKASGKSRNVGFRYTANKPARVAITSFADNSRHRSAWAADTYRRARARGARHPHAVRILARGWVRVHLGMLDHRHPLRPHPTPRRTAAPRSVT